MTVLDVLSLIAPAFDSLSEEVRQSYIDLVTPQVSSCLFGADYELAIAYLAADLITQAQQTPSTSGTATMKKEGDLQVMYGSLTPSESGYTTKYGRMFDVLKKKHVLTITVANANVGC